MNWCVTSDDGVKAMCKDMGFTIPFKKNLKSDNVLVNEANKYTEDGKTPVSWNFSTMPSEEWKNGSGFCTDKLRSRSDRCKLGKSYNSIR